MSALHPLLDQSLFVAGTDTGVGKTWVTTHLLAAWVAAGHRAAGMKPVAAGAEATADGLRNDDALALQAAGNVALPYGTLNPCCLSRPTSPHLAVRGGQNGIDIETILRRYREIDAISDRVAVEGAGGWWAPIGEPAADGTRGPTMEEVARAVALPVLLVVGMRLGALNHALLTAAAIRDSGLALAAWVANPVEPGFVDFGDYVESLQRRLPAPRVCLPAGVRQW